jgi:AsmA family protein
VPFPPTPPFRLRGRLDYAAGRVRFLDAEGRMGQTDFSGGLIATVAGVPRPVVAAEVRSRRVDLADLAGLFGAEPGRPTTPGMTEGQREAAARRERAPRLLSDAPLDLPRMRSVDVHVDYQAARIEGRRMPFDSLTTQFDVVEGVVKVHRLVMPVGDGELSTRFTMTPQPDGRSLRVEGGVELRRVDFSRLLGVAGGVRGSGRLGGVGRFEGQGRSLAEMAASAEGGLTMAMVGGTLSAFLIDLSGLRLGRALLSALGLPERERIECLVADFPLRRGTLTARTLVMETETALVTGSGRVSLAEERLDLRIRTESKRLTVGLLPVPILVRGTLKEPSVGLEPAGAAARAGAAAGLGALLAPLAALPTIQFGTADDDACERLRARAARGAGR